MSVLRGAGRCHRCSLEVPAGAEVTWSRTEDGRNVFSHAGPCPNAGMPSPSTPPSGQLAASSHGAFGKVWLKAEFTAEHGSETMAVHRTLMLSATRETDLLTSPDMLGAALKDLARIVRHEAETGVR